jgi:SAM-dependent methyltransferase
MSTYVARGQRFFSLMSHRLYDLSLYRWITNHIWGCPTQQLIDGYLDNVSNRHLEVGVGTGFLLAKSLTPDYLNQLTLMDLNKSCLIKAGKRLGIFNPELIHQDIAQPLPKAKRFRSIGINYVLHCVPGSFAHNAKVFKHLSDALEDNGVLFGATLLNSKRHSSLVARLFMRLLNVVGIFHNRTHTLKDLEAALAENFAQVDIQMVGSAAVFTARKERLE